MTALPNVAGVIKLQYHFTYGTDANVMTHMFFAIGSPSAINTADLQSFCNLARSSYVTNCLSLSTNAVQLGTVTATDLTTTTSAPVASTGSNSGTRSLGPPNASTSVITNLKIARRYRGGHPRIYWPWGNSGDLYDAQHWTSSFIGLCQTGINALVAALQGSSFASIPGPVLANVSYYQHNALRPTPTWDPVSSVVVNPIPGVQRRRLRP